MMLCIVKLPWYSLELAVSFVYGSNSEHERKDLWEEIGGVADGPLLNSLPWTILGDFNQILHNSEHSTADNFVSTRQMREFRDCLHKTGVFDLSYRGNNFTWINNRSNDPIAKRGIIFFLTTLGFSPFPTLLESLERLICQIITFAASP